MTKFEQLEVIYNQLEGSLQKLAIYHGYSTIDNYLDDIKEYGQINQDLQVSVDYLIMSQGIIANLMLKEKGAEDVQESL